MIKGSIGLLLLFGGVLAEGSVITLQSNGSTPSTCSGSVLVCESNNMSGTNYVLPADPSGWATPPGDGAVWISYENTGLWGMALSDANCSIGSTPGAGSCLPNAKFYETFTDTQLNLVLSLTVWADDTAAVYLDGSEILAPYFGQSTTACAPSPYVTCTSGATYTGNIGSGTHTLEFDVYQTGGWMYGLMYDGTVTSQAVAPPVPEPASLFLIGSGLAGLGLMRRRSRI